MDSVSNKFKRELCRNKSILKNYRTELCLGLACFARELSTARVELGSSEGAVISLYKQALEGLVPMKTGFSVAEQGRITVARLENISDRVALINFFSILGIDQRLQTLAREQLYAFLTGVFLVCGRLSDPDKSFSLEFSPYDVSRLSKLHELLERAGVKALRSQRRGKPFLYIHNSESIEVFLTLIGGSDMVLEIMGKKIVNERRCVANRVSNCDTANISRTIVAANAQISAIKRLLESVPQDEIPPQLYELAVVRLKNPEASLSELAVQLTPPLSRSGVSHRMRRLMELAESG